MHPDRILTTCPYLVGSLDGGLCNAALTLLRNIQDIDTDMCLSRHFELCDFYVSKLQTIDTLTV
jgi:hypothetical protein